MEDSFHLTQQIIKVGTLCTEQVAGRRMVSQQNIPVSPSVLGAREAGQSW